MEYTKLGRTGMDVSRICLGTMGFGDPNRWIHSWVIGEEPSREVVRHAVELGINFFDTANVYSLGVSEEILGRALKDFADRDEIVLATKVFGRMHDGPNGQGLSRKAIMAQIDASLRRLGTDYVDLYIIHRWDYATPIEETMSALNDVVRAGKARYLGASAMYAWQFATALGVAERNGWAPFVSMQDHYNLIYREEEREMLPLCRDRGVASTPYSPLASGRLTRDPGERGSARSESDTTQARKYDPTADADAAIIRAVARIAEEKGVARAQVALAWLLAKSPVAAPIVGATTTAHLDIAVGALGVELTDDDMAELERHYVPHPVVGAE